MRKLLFLLLFCASGAYAQGVKYQLSPPAPNAQVLVCPSPDAGYPCPVQQAIFSDVGLTVPINQPVNLGSGGFFSFYVTAGTYTIQLLGPGYNSSNRQVVSIGSGGGNVSTLTAPVTLNGTTSTSALDCYYGGGSGFDCLTVALNAGNPSSLVLPNLTAPPNGTFGMVSDGNPLGQTLSWAPIAGLATTPINTATIASDTFIRANGGLGANWTAESDTTDTGTMTITSNSAASSGGVWSASFWSGAGSFTPATGQWAQVTFNGAGAGTFLAPIVMASAGGNYYTCASSIGANGTVTQFGINKVIGGASAVLSGGGGGAYGGPINTGDVIKIVIKNTGGAITSANPSQIACFRNGVQIAVAYGDTSLTTGTPGLAAFGNANNMTAWSGGNQASCTKGQWAYDSGFIYVCSAADVWLRATIATF